MLRTKKPQQQQQQSNDNSLNNEAQQQRELQEQQRQRQQLEELLRQQQEREQKEQQEREQAQKQKEQEQQQAQQQQLPDLTEQWKIKVEDLKRALTQIQNQLASPQNHNGPVSIQHRNNNNNNDNNNNMMIPHSIPELRLKPISPPELSEKPTSRLVIDVEALKWLYEPADKRSKISRDVATAIDKASASATNLLVAWISLRFCRKGDILTHVVVDFASPIFAAAVRTVLTSVRYNCNFGKIANQSQRQEVTSAGALPLTLGTTIVVQDFGRRINNGEGLGYQDLIDAFGDTKNDNNNDPNSPSFCSVIPAFEDGTFYVTFNSTFIPLALFQTPRFSKIFLTSMLREFGVLVSAAETLHDESELQQVFSKKHVVVAVPPQPQQQVPPPPVHQHHQQPSVNNNNNNNNNNNMSIPQGFMNLNNNNNNHNNNGNQMINTTMQSQQQQQQHGQHGGGSLLAPPGPALLPSSGSSSSSSVLQQQQPPMMMTMDGNNNNNTMMMNNNSNMMFPNQSHSQQQQQQQKIKPPLVKGVFYYRARFSTWEDFAQYIDLILPTEDWYFFGKALVHPPFFEQGIYEREVMMNGGVFAPNFAYMREMNKLVPQVREKLIANPKVLRQLLLNPMGPCSIVTNWLTTDELKCGIRDVMFAELCSKDSSMFTSGFFVELFNHWSKMNDDDSTSSSALLPLNQDDDDSKNKNNDKNDTITDLCQNFLLAPSLPVSSPFVVSSSSDYTNKNNDDQDDKEQETKNKSNQQIVTEIYFNEESDKPFFDSIESQTKDLGQPFFVGLFLDSLTAASSSSSSSSHHGQFCTNYVNNLIQLFSGLSPLLTESHLRFLHKRLGLSSDDLDWLIMLTPSSKTTNYALLLQTLLTSPAAKKTFSVSNLLSACLDACFSRPEKDLEDIPTAKWNNARILFSTLAGCDASSREVETKWVRTLVAYLNRHCKKSLSDAFGTEIVAMIDNVVPRLYHETLKVLIAEATSDATIGIFPLPTIESWKMMYENKKPLEHLLVTPDAAPAPVPPPPPPPPAHQQQHQFQSKSAPLIAVPPPKPQETKPKPKPASTGFRLIPLSEATKADEDDANEQKTNSASEENTNNNANPDAAAGVTPNDNFVATVGPRRGLTMNQIRETLLKRLVPTWSQGFESYPPDGFPFPDVTPESYRAFADHFTGLYYFKKLPHPAAYIRNVAYDPMDSTTLHPITKGEYKVSPQAFFRGGKINPIFFMKENSIPEDRFKKWYADQSYRDEELDLLCIWELKIKYPLEYKKGDVVPATSGSGLLPRRRSRSVTEQNDDENGGGEAKTEKKEQQLLLLTPEEVLEKKKLEEWFTHYPQTGHPFPENDRKITKVTIDNSRGFYLFHIAAPLSATSTFHPTTRREYRATPQAIFDQQELDVKTFCRENSLQILKFREYLRDQKVRVEEFDKLILEKFEVKYLSS